MIIAVSKDDKMDKNVSLLIIHLCRNILITIAVAFMATLQHTKSHLMNF